MAARKGVLMRINGPQCNLDSDRPPQAPWSLSILSNTSIAPEELLPPLPLYTNHSSKSSERFRLSATSVDTVDSSILGTIMSSSSCVGRDPSTVSASALQTNSHSPGLHDLSYTKSQGESSTITLGLPAGKWTMLGCRSGQVSTGSFRAIGGTDDLLRTETIDRELDRCDNNIDAADFAGFSFQAINATSWEHALSLEEGRRSTIPYPLLSPPVTQAGAPQDGTFLGRLYVRTSVN